jgi:hypothetical protein
MEFMAKPITALQNLKKKARRQRRGHGFNIIKWSLWAVVFLIFSGAVGAIGIFFHLSKGLPKISSLKD